MKLVLRAGVIHQLRSQRPVKMKLAIVSAGRHGFEIRDHRLTACLQLLILGDKSRRKSVDIDEVCPPNLVPRTQARRELQDVTDAFQVGRRFYSGLKILGQKVERLIRAVRLILSRLEMKRPDE